MNSTALVKLKKKRAAHKRYLLTEEGKIMLNMQNLSKSKLKSRAEGQGLVT